VSSAGNAGVLAGMALKADEDVGAPTNGAPSLGARGWYSRGYLPHVDSPQVLQSVTYRLADSLPREKLEQLQEELRHLPETHRDLAKRKQIETWLDAGMGGCALRHPKVASFVQQSFLHFHGERYHLHAWCVMPNHVHVLLEPLIDLASIVQGWKSFTARWILRNRAALGLEIPEAGPVWMREYWDRYIRDENHYQTVTEYIHQNPVKADLCNRPEEWPWSSASVMMPADAYVPADVKTNADEDVGAPRNLGRC